MADLLIDIGNSFVKFAFHENGTIGKVYKCPYSNPAVYIDQFMAGKKADKTVISSVTNINADFLNYLKEKSDKTLILGPDTPIPLINKYSTPSTLGADRLAAAIGANGLFKHENCIVFDFGTALTVDFVSKKGEYLGGNISLGLKTRFDAISRYTEKLPLLQVPDEFEKGGIGNSTVTAIENGIASGMLFEIESYIEKYKGHKIIFTGGDAIYFASKLKKTIFVVFNLVLVGLSYIARYNSNE